MLKIRCRISDTDQQNSHSFVDSSYSLPDVSAGRIARELWWTSQEFSPAGIINTMALHAQVSPGVLGSETSHPIDVKNQQWVSLPCTTSCKRKWVKYILNNLRNKWYFSRNVPVAGDDLDTPSRGCEGGHYASYGVTSINFPEIISE
jgi:hypothetical protein